MSRLLSLLAILALLVGCDSGASGPGDLTGILMSPGPVLGGAVLQVEGKGITKFSDSGGTRVFSAPTGAPDTYRVLLVSAAPGELRFRVSVEDKGARKPSVSVVNLVSEGNLTLPPTADYQVRFSKK
jgi:hypothetical protein